MNEDIIVLRQLIVSSNYMTEGAEKERYKKMILLLSNIDEYIVKLKSTIKELEDGGE